jgi:adenine-specific DNA-methyltransferase
LGGTADLLRNRDGASDVAALHDRCGVYTKSAMVERILDEIGWCVCADLIDKRLLEPAAGQGAFIIEAGRRLLHSLRLTSVPMTFEVLQPRIRGFELHDGEAAKGRAKLVSLLIAEGLNGGEAQEIAACWLATADFLLIRNRNDYFTHCAGNPPYSRWSKVPPSLRAAYEAVLPKHIAKGDLFLPFLDGAIGALWPGGKLGFLCSNRWEFMAFAEGFRARRMPEVCVHLNEPANAYDVYERPVDIYPSILVLERRDQPFTAPSPRARVRKNLSEAGFEVRVGPALGCTDAYVIASQSTQIEPQLLAGWVGASDVSEGEEPKIGKSVICLYDSEGQLVDPTKFPHAYRHLLRFKSQLEQRSIVKKHGAQWYRPIDRVYAAAWAAPKILIPELAKVPRVALDRSGAIPAHGLYAIMAKRPEADVEALYQQLVNGGLAKELDGKVPKVKGGYMRCYKRFLEQITIST